MAFQKRWLCRDAFSVAGAVQETCSSELLGGPGAQFPERRLHFGASRCSTSYDPASIFRGRRSTLDRRTGKIAKCNGMRPSALH